MKTTSMPYLNASVKKNKDLVSDTYRAGKAFSAGLLILCICFYLFFLFLDGPVFETDSYAYLEDPYARNIPVYILFLKLCRLIPFPGGGTYEGYSGVYQAAFVQCLLWGYAAYRAGLFTGDVFKGKEQYPGGKPVKEEPLLDSSGEKSRSYTQHDVYMTRTAILAGTFLQLAVSLLNRFAAPRKSMYSNTILTEALSMPLFILFIVSLYYFLRRKKTSDLVILTIISFILINTRGQMKAVLVIWGAVCFLYMLVLKSSRDIKRFIVSVLLIAGVYILSDPFIKTVNLITHDRWTAAKNSEAVLCNLLYVADEDTVSLFKDGDDMEKDWYIRIRQLQEEKGALLSAVRDDADIFGRQSHYANMYDVIGYEIVHTVLFEDVYAYVNVGSDSVLLMQEYESELAQILMRGDLSAYARLAAENMVCALAYSNARFTRRLLPVSFALYLIYVIFLICLLIKKQQAFTATHTFNDAEALSGKTEKSAGDHEAIDSESVSETKCSKTVSYVYDKVITLSVIVLIAIVINSAVVSLTIFPQGRYMIYCMGLFYTALILMAAALIYDFKVQKDPVRPV